MTYRIRPTRSARRDLNQLPEAVAAAALAFIFGTLPANPHRVGRPLLGELAGLYGGRRGQYRVIYSIAEDIVTVNVVRVAHRARAYR